jgi:hypothetical protein
MCIYISTFDVRTKICHFYIDYVKSHFFKRLCGQVEHGDAHKIFLFGIF